MSVDIPPVEPPVALQPAQIPRNAAVQTYGFGAHRVHLVGFSDLDERKIRTLIEESPNAEQLVIALTVIAYRAGLFTDQIAYAMAGRDLYIALMPRQVRTINAPPELHAFFASSVENGQLRSSEFERARVLASAYSDRERLYVQPRFVSASEESVDLYLRTTASTRRTSPFVQFEASNHGSRFAGRNLIGASLSANLSHGYQATFRGKTAPAQINQSSSRGEYLEGGFDINRISAAGISGLSLRRLDFLAQAGDAGLRGWYQEAAIEHSNIVHASLTSRSTYTLRASYGDRETESEADGATLFQERFGQIELSPGYAASFARNRFEASATIAGGASVAQIGSAADEQFVLVRPMLRFVWNQSERHALSIAAAGQWSQAVVPESRQWTLGGYGTMSAYAPASLIGDSGSLMRAAQSYTRPLSTRTKVSVELFAEYGHVQRNPFPGLPALSDRAADAGVGLDLSWGRFVDLRVSAAVPLLEPEIYTSAERTDFYASIGMRY
jgi:hypothetical protein